MTPDDVPATDSRMKVVSAFNPGVIDTPQGVMMLVRIAESVAPEAQREGFVALPRWTFDRPGTPGRIEIDYVAQDSVDAIDPRVVETRDTGLIRLTFTSHLRVVNLGKDGVTLDKSTLGQALRFDPMTSYETFGVEDPRITCIGDVYYFTYVAVSEHGAATALASTTDFKTFKRHGIIFPSENKDVLLFPRKVSGAYVALHRPNPRTHFARPEMWLAWSDDLIHWGAHEPFFGGTTQQSPTTPATGASANAAASVNWSMGRVGGGCPPIETPQGWLEIYHGNNKAPNSPPGDVGIYMAAALLLDIDNPRRILKQSQEPIMVPEADFEQKGFVANVAFPTAIIDRKDRYHVYYGAADTSVGVLEWDKAALMATLK